MDDVSRGQRAVPANVTVTVKKISAEAVKKSGSIRYTHHNNGCIKYVDIVTHSPMYSIYPLLQYR